MPDHLHRASSLALMALFAGAAAIGSAGIFVRLSETGPIATAFWRGALALPLLGVWAWLEQRARARRADAGQVEPLPGYSRFFWAGLFFAGDLALWHWSLLLTSVAASTLEANLAPVFVTLFMRLFWGHRPAPRFIAALALAAGGLLLVVSPGLGRPGGSLLGDALGIATACFYAGYLIAVSRLRANVGTGVVMFRSTLAFTVMLLPLALTTGKFFPDTPHGWLTLVGLATVAQFLGQSLIAYALAHLPATFGAVGLYVQPVAAAVYAWLLLGERLTAVQVVGGAVVLGAIALARSAEPTRASSQSSTKRQSVSR